MKPFTPTVARLSAAPALSGTARNGRNGSVLAGRRFQRQCSSSRDPLFALFRAQKLERNRQQPRIHRRFVAELRVALGAVPLLASNANYKDRFRPLGLALLTKQPGTSFEQTYGDMAKEISFEYRQFLKNVETGYRADLCSWDWKAKFKLVKSGAPTQVKIDAGKGWQPSRLIVTEGEEYGIQRRRTWTISKAGSAIDADGDEKGRGKTARRAALGRKPGLRSGEPFELGKFGIVHIPRQRQPVLKVPRGLGGPSR